MHEEGVGDGPEAGAGLVVVDGDGFFAQVGGGHHQSLHARIGEEQVLQRGVGQKDAEPGNAGGDFRGDAVGRTGASENDGTGGVCSSASSSGVRSQRARAASRSRTMTASGFAVAMLALA